jgi:clan AA aspartic protease
MAAIRGSFADDAPVVQITLQSASGSLPLTGIIDTGFDGFAAIPASIAASVELQTDMVAEVEYADGTIGSVELAPARIVLDAEAREGLIHVQPGTEEALVGREFLRAFGKILVVSVSSRTVVLIDRLAELAEI